MIRTPSIPSGASKRQATTSTSTTRQASISMHRQQRDGGTTAAEVETTTSPNPKVKSSRLINLVMIGLLVCCLLSTATNLMHHDAFIHHSPHTALARAMMEFKQGRMIKTNAKQITKTDTRTMEKSTLAGLHCEPYGGPSNFNAKEMVYWQNIPIDQQFASPLKVKQGQHKQYLTFEPDGGGWNNIRMAMETIVGLAIAMGRTLVLPPAQGMYLLKKDGKTQTTDFTFAHFFPMMQMAKENNALDIITMTEFLEMEAMTGNMVDKVTGRISFPPGNRTNWDGQNVTPLKEWLRNVTYIEHFWKPEKCLAAFPASGNPKDVQYLQEQLQHLLTPDGGSRSTVKTFDRGQYAGVDAPAQERLQENLAERNELCIYDSMMQSQRVVHFMCYHKMRIRYLVHFYAFLFFENWTHDLWMKRFMRDHMRYMDEIQCAAARIVTAVRERSKQRHGWEKGNFDTMHIRRGDFQFKDTRIDAPEILNNSKPFLARNKTVYIATDEHNKMFFLPFRHDGYDIVFMDDYMDLLAGVNTNYFGMIDQLVASRGDVFLGCWHSTFTGFIMRMRGYHSTKSKLPGYDEGILPTSFYYANKRNTYQMQEYQPLHGAFFNREFPTSWRDIDKNVVGMIANDDEKDGLESTNEFVSEMDEKEGEDRDEEAEDKELDAEEEADLEEDEADEEEAIKA